MECTLKIFSGYINLLNISDDTIVLGQKINNLADDFFNFVLNENDLRYTNFFSIDIYNLRKYFVLYIVNS